MIINFGCNKYKTNKIDIGGNSIIYEFKDNNGKSYVAKVFKCYDKKKKEQRYKRFKQEVKIITTKLKKINGVVPCFHSHLPNSLHEKAYYIMPKCNKFNIHEKKNICQKLNDILLLAKTLKEIHKEGVAHRDIKPQNILIYNGILCFTDFGIAIEHENPNRLTYLNEKVGPAIILPPELRNVDSFETNFEFYKSDVYLLAKVLWMYLNENDYGFYGEYRRDNKLIYFSDKIDEPIKTTEPLQLIFEKSTYDDISDRITLDSFIFFLEQQILIIENRIDNKILEKYMFDEKIKSNIVMFGADKIQYTDYDKIFDFLGVIRKSMYLTIKDFFTGNVLIIIDDFNIYLKDNIFCLKFFYSRKEIKLSFKMKDMVYDIHSEKIVININNDDKLHQQVKTFDNQLLFSESDLYLSSQYIIEMNPKYKNEN